MSNEPELKARDKVVLRMTREGAVEEKPDGWHRAACVKAAGRCGAGQAR